MNLGLKLEEVREEVLDLLGHGRSDRPADRDMTVAGHTDRLSKLLAPAAATQRQPSAIDSVPR